MNFHKIAASLITVAALSGCAHPLSITPNIAKIEREASAPPRSKSKVGYYINDAFRNQEVTSAGGGGDKVTSTPYRDLEGGLYTMFSNVFEGVTLLKAPSDKKAIGEAGISYVITPEIQVSSSSPSPFTWPPTHFNVDLTCTISDASGQLINTAKVVGQGDAEFSEFKSDFGLSGKRAAENALLQMQRKLLEMKLQPNAQAGAMANATLSSNQK